MFLTCSNVPYGNGIDCTSFDEILKQVQNDGLRKCKYYLQSIDTVYPLFISKRGNLWNNKEKGYARDMLNEAITRAQRNTSSK